MARNEEKANTMLARFLQMKKEEGGKQKKKRPYLASLCRDLADADKWRQEILREIGKKVMEIQNPGLGEHRIRDLNDEINKLIREKFHWENRIIELGGRNYKRSAPKIFGDDGEEVVASGKGPGYKYFGAAKQLPGVKELFETPALPKRKRNRHDLYKRIDADYYGYRDEEDGVLVKVEAAAEKERRAKAISEWKKLKALRDEARLGVRSGEPESEEPDFEIGDPIKFFDEDYDAETGANSTREEDSSVVDGIETQQFIAHVPLPDEKEIERMVVEKKKADLLNKYASEALVSEEKEAKELLNIKR